MVIKICSLDQNEGNLIEIFVIEIPSLILQINCDQVILLIAHTFEHAKINKQTVCSPSYRLESLSLNISS